MPAMVPAPSTDSRTTWPREFGSPPSRGVSPSRRTKCTVSSTVPYGSLATIKRSSASPMYKPCPLPNNAKYMSFGSLAVMYPMATLPSNCVTALRNAAWVSRPEVRPRSTMAGMTFASVVIGSAKCKRCRSRSSVWLSTSPFSTATETL
ncbi:unannotated protein [freshwater metagenome]|uniref:Unannotated protein n=1 Tax=freshwater metagenome TaxID=449393 RepID=A0A6J6IG44_9ZZZZ